MGDFNVFVENRLTNCVFANLDMAETFCSHIGRPGDACLVVVVNGSGLRAKGLEKVKIFEDVTDVESVFRAFVSGVDF